MAQEFFINSQELEDKIRSLLPSQGGAGAGFDLSASTQIIPIIDLTESAEGSNVRQDLQTAFTFANVNQSFINNTTTSIIVNTGYWRLFGNSNIVLTTSAIGNQIIISDGISNKNLLQHEVAGGTAEATVSSLNFDFLVKLEAGNSVSCVSSSSKSNIAITYRQIADIDGVLINPN